MKRRKGRRRRLARMRRRSGRWGGQGRKERPCCQRHRSAVSGNHLHGPQLTLPITCWSWCTWCTWRLWLMRRLPHGRASADRRHWLLLPCAAMRTPPSSLVPTDKLDPVHKQITSISLVVWTAMHVCSRVKCCQTVLKESLQREFQVVRNLMIGSV